MRWIEIHSNNLYGITTEPNADSRLVRVKSYADVFAEYLTHPEPKSASGDHPCSRSDRGLLDRQLIVGTRIIPIGKESNRLEEVENGTIETWDEVRAIYQDSRQDPFRLYVIQILKRMTCSDLTRKTGYKNRHIKAIRNAAANPSPKLRSILIGVAAEYARKILPENVLDDMDACAAFMIYEHDPKLKNLVMNNPRSARDGGLANAFCRAFDGPRVRNPFGER